MTRLRQWLFDRTGLDRLAGAMLREHIPGGARWRYVFGSVLVALFVIQAVTGVLLMTVYSPSATTAWSSVWYIQTQMTAGWLIRGLHHYAAQAFVVLAPVHILQVIFAKAYRPPREFNWWIGMALLGVVLGAALTGYLLPWDQRGYWATKVATNIMGLTPLVGESLQRVLVGGPEYGHLTLTRFFTLHVMVLPGLFVVLALAHVALFRRHGLTVSPKLASRPGGEFWPDQLLRDSIASLVVLAGLLWLAWNSHARGDALLDAPADAAAADYPARPEWYFLFLFQMLKHFEGPTMEVVGAMVVPGVVTLLMAAAPFYHRVLPARVAHATVVLFAILLFGSVWRLTYGAIRDDRDPPAAVVAQIEAKQRAGTPLSREEDAALRAHRLNRQRAEADRVARRALLLAAEQGIPPAGPLEMLQADPFIQGPLLFARHCAACHRHNGTDGRGEAPVEKATSSDLGGFGSKEWVLGLLKNPMDDRHFGRMTREDGSPGHTRMAKFIEVIREENAATADARTLEENFDAVAAYLEDESRAPGRWADEKDTDWAAIAAATPVSAETTLRRGRAFFLAVCHECHTYQGERTGTTNGPEMYGYGSVAWIERMIANPADDSLYRATGREKAMMPSFAEELSERERNLLARWLLRGPRAQPEE